MPYKGKGGLRGVAEIIYFINMLVEEVFSFLDYY